VEGESTGTHFEDGGEAWSMPLGCAHCTAGRNPAGIFGASCIYSVAMGHDAWRPVRMEFSLVETFKALSPRT